MIKQGLPYGPKARLLLVHICTQAVLQKSPSIELAESMSGFIRELGFDVTGGARGTIAQFKEQLHRLAAARMQLGLWSKDVSRTISSQPIEGFDIWLPSNPNQQTLWSNVLHLDPRFYASLQDRAMLIDSRALSAVSHSARQIDILLFLGYRLSSLKRRYVIPWSNLYEQFGSDNKRLRKFKETFSQDIRDILEIYPKAPVKLIDRGMQIDPAPPQELFVPKKLARK